MKASLTLGRPENWQDFESLCKKLWGEIWRCPETKKNGRSGQDQSGVDVYGIPYNDPGEYYGIQCKGKDEYTHKQLTKKEIETEIGKAKNFEPDLKKFYFATTAVKDAKIEAFIRKKNAEHIKAGLFEVHIYSWEDIVDLINENQETYDYYVRSINFKTNNDVSVTFNNFQSEITIYPKFRKVNIDYCQMAIPTAGVPPMFSTFEIIDSFKHEINHSFCPLFFVIHNTGSQAIEDYKLTLEINGEIQEINDKNEFKSGGLINVLATIHNPKISDNWFSDDFSKGVVKPNAIKNILVGDDQYRSDTIYLKPKAENYQILLKWKFLSKHFKKEGELTINVEHFIDLVNEVKLVKDPKFVRWEEGEIEDYLEDVRNKESDD